MRRSIAVVVATLFVGVQFCLPAMPAAGKAGSCCPGQKKMACCSAQKHCAAGSHCAADATAATAEGTACLRAAGCGHSTPGVAAPSLDPTLFAASALALAAPMADRHADTSPAWPASISHEPLSPPPRG